MRKILLGMIFSACAANAVVADTSFSINIELEDAVVTTTSYQCGANEAATVHYITSQDDVLALVPIDDDPRIFVGVVSASGARYVAGPFEWWSKGPSGTLRNLVTEQTLLDCTAIE